MYSDIFTRVTVNHFLNFLSFSNKNSSTLSQEFFRFLHKIYPIIYSRQITEL